MPLRNTLSEAVEAAKLRSRACRPDSQRLIDICTMSSSIPRIKLDEFSSLLLGRFGVPVTFDYGHIYTTACLDWDDAHFGPRVVVYLISLTGIQVELLDGRMFSGYGAEASRQLSECFGENSVEVF